MTQQKCGYTSMEKVANAAGPDNGPEAMYADQTLERKAQELEVQRDWLRNTLSSIGDAVIATDAQARITFLNPVAERLTGWKADDASGEPLEQVFRLINEETQQAARQPIHRALKEGIADALDGCTATTQSSPVELDPTDLRGLKILVVDDEPDACQLIEYLLVDCGAQVLTANEAMNALWLIESERPDILVSDIGMPTVDGYEFLRRVRALGRARGGALPAVALTAYAPY